MRTKRLIVIVFLAVAGIAFFLYRFVLGQWSADQLVVSKETTYITAQLDEEGYPDYFAALNQRLSEGVSSDNNAAIPFFRVIGPGDIPAASRAEFFDALGIPPLPESGDYLEGWETYARDVPETEYPKADSPDWNPLDNFLQQQELASQRPWRRDEFPHVAKWLDANNDRLDRIAQAVERTRSYFPVVRQGHPPLLLNACWNALDGARRAATALSVRAMLRLEEGDFEGAWDDLYAIRRLARHVAEGATLVDGLMANALEAIALHGTVTLLANTALSQQQLTVFRNEFEELEPIADIAVRFDIGERFVFLDTICNSAKYGPGVIPGQSDADERLGELPTVVDWNVPLEMANDWMDRYVLMASIQEPAERRAAIDVLDNDVGELALSIKQPKRMLSAFLSRGAASERIGEMLVALVCPSTSVAIDAHDRIRTNHSLVRIAFALAAYKLNEGQFPASLNELVPDHIAELPNDDLTGEAIVYKKSDDGYLLYSFGQNGQDDGAVSLQDTVEGVEGDDVVVRMPPKVSEP